MKIRANFNERVLVHSQSLEWIPSPMAGVYRRPLDRVGNEIARATSIVRYAAGSHFSPHVHTGGEEFIVLSGVFQDEHQNYPKGSYVRNPPTSSHTPRSNDGCIIFVKLWQFQPDDRTHVIKSLSLDLPQNSHPNTQETILYADSVEIVKLVHLAPNSLYKLKNLGGIEILVLEGELIEQDDCLTKYSWLRLGPSLNLCSQAGEKGAVLWLKTGHLLDVQNQIDRVMSVDKD